MNSKIPDNLQFVVIGNEDDLTSILFQNIFLESMYPGIHRTYIRSVECDVLEEIRKISNSGRLPFVVTTEKIIEEFEKEEEGKSIKDLHSPVLVSNSVSDIPWEKELGKIGIRIYLGDKVPTFEMDIFREYREFAYTQMIEAQENLKEMRESRFKEETDIVS
jgi:hypothetical protein